MCFGLFKQTTGVPKPAPIIRRTITSSELGALLSEKFPSAHLRLSDNNFQLCDISDVEAFLKVDETNRIKYQSEIMDCDDFAWALLGQFSMPPWSGIALGFAWTERHALNICVDTNDDIWFIEPQTDNIKSKLEDWQGQIVYEIFI